MKRIKGEQSKSRRGHSSTSSSSRSSMNPVMKVILEGVYDPGSTLSHLRGCQHLLQFIWKDLRNYWNSLIKMPSPSKYDGSSWYMHPSIDTSSQEYFAPIADLEAQYYKFPKPSGININMMPFIVGETWEQCRLPNQVKPYWNMIHQCIMHHSHREHHHMWDREEHASGKI